jgi:hypothetical protein
MKWSCTLQWYLCYVGEEHSHIDSNLFLYSNVKSNYKLGEEQSSIWNPFFTHMKWEPLIGSSALSWCGWLASSFDQCLHERTI